MSPCFSWLTPDGPAALALVRLTGPEAALRGVLARVPVPGRALRTPVHAADGAVLDDALAIAAQAAAPGAQSAVLVCLHGGAGLRRAIERALLARGFTAASPELGARWHALAACPSPAARDWVLAHPHGRPPFDPALLRRPAMVVITGPTNAGKSTLLNAWCGHRRALAGPMPGTTRDLVSAVVAHRGWSFELVDSAGLREQGDALEQAGRALAEAARASADAVLVLVPPGARPPVCTGPAASRTLLLAAKADLTGAAASGTPVLPAHGVRPGLAGCPSEATEGCAADARGQRPPLMEASDLPGLRWAAPGHVSEASAGAMLERIGDALLALLGLPRDPAGAARGLSAGGGA